MSLLIAADVRRCVPRKRTRPVPPCTVSCCDQVIDTFQPWTDSICADRRDLQIWTVLWRVHVPLPQRRARGQLDDGCTQ
jgi:hypothetical protein